MATGALDRARKVLSLRVERVCSFAAGADEFAAQDLSFDRPGGKPGGNADNKKERHQNKMQNRNKNREDCDQPEYREQLK